MFIYSDTTKISTWPVVQYSDFVWFCIHMTSSNGLFDKESPEYIFLSTFDIYFIDLKEIKDLKILAKRHKIYLAPAYYWWKTSEIFFFSTDGKIILYLQANFSFSNHTKWISNVSRYFKNIMIFSKTIHCKKQTIL